MDFRQTELTNGLTVVAEINPNAASMAMGFFVRTGSRDEDESISGVSHFLEHMMFKGTDRRSAFDISRELDDLGASYNASTSEENTYYYAAALPEHQDRIADLFCDMLRPKLQSEDFDLEKNVILDEIARYEDLPHFKTFEKTLATFFRGHPLSNRVLGTNESIAALTLQQMREYFERRYSPGNMVLVAAGDLDFDRFVDQVTDRCSRWQPFDVGREFPAAPGRTDTVVMTDTKVVRQHIGVMSPAPSMQDDQRYVAHIAATIIGGSTNSRLFYALVDPAIADMASMSYDGMDAAGGFLSYLSCDPDRAGEVLKIFRRELKKFMDEGPTEIELTGARNQQAVSWTLGGEIPMGRLMRIGFNWMYLGEYVPMDVHVDRLLAVTSEQVLELVRRYDLLAGSTFALGPIEEL